MTRRLLLNTDPIKNKLTDDISLEEMINRTFYIYAEDTDIVRQSKTRMTKIATGLLDQMRNAVHSTGFEKPDNILFADKHRQQKVMRQELVFNALLGYPNDLILHR